MLKAISTEPLKICSPATDTLTTAPDCKVSGITCQCCCQRFSCCLCVSACLPFRTKTCARSKGLTATVTVKADGQQQGHQNKTFRDDTADVPQQLQVNTSAAFLQIATQNASQQSAAAKDKPQSNQLGISDHPCKSAQGRTSSDGECNTIDR